MAKPVATSSNCRREVENSIFNSLTAEFGTTVLALFEVNSFSAPRSAEVKQGRAPGIYVVTHAERVIRIGKSQDNAHKRCLTHFLPENNTGGIMTPLISDDLCVITLITIRSSIPKEKYMHWIHAFETFLQLNINPKVRSRIG